MQPPTRNEGEATRPALQREREELDVDRFLQPLPSYRGQSPVHTLLCEKPLQPIGEVSPLLWTTILGEQVSDKAVRELQTDELERGCRYPLLREGCRNIR